VAGLGVAGGNAYGEPSSGSGRKKEKRIEPPRRKGRKEERQRGEKVAPPLAGFPLRSNSWQASASSLRYGQVAV